MVGKSEIKLITSLQQKKYRNINQLFFVEGIKGVKEFLDSDFELEHIYTTNSGVFKVSANLIREVDENQLKKISALRTPNTALAVFRMRKEKPVKNKGLTLLLDDVRDPGNLGTIIRMCDWFGVSDLVCSEATVDCYNPKVVQSTMGSLGRVNVVYTDLHHFIKSDGRPAIVTTMEGASVYEADIPENALLVMGNEANGVSQGVIEMATLNYSIPRFGDLRQTESLNVATATAILLSEFKRRF